MESASKSKILLFGVTGYIGKYIVKASVKLGHPTYAFVRPETNAQNTSKTKLIQSFKNWGVNILFGELKDEEGLVEAIRKVDVVFSLMGHRISKQLEEHIHIVSAIKVAGNIKRYFPSEFGFDVDRANVLEPAKGKLDIKAKIRQAIREEGIPFTFLSCNFTATYFLSRLGQVQASGIPKDRIFIMGDGNRKVIFVDEHDIATYAIKAAEDERTLNKILYMRPPADIYSHNELISLWEKKRNVTLERIYVAEEEVHKKIEESTEPFSFAYAIAHAGFIRGEMTNFDIDTSIGVEASQLYSDVKYITVDEYMDQFL